MNWYNHRMRYFQLSEFDSPDAPGSGAKMDKDIAASEARLMRAMKLQNAPPAKRSRRDATPRGTSTASTAAPEVATIRVDTKEMKKSQKELDTARKNMEKAKAELDMAKAAEKFLQEGLDAGQPVQPAMKTTKKKRETAQTKLSEREADVETKTAAYKEKFKRDPLGA